MKSIEQNLKEIPQTKIRSERAFILSEVIFELAKSNSWPTNKPDCAKIVAIKTSHLETDDLRDFLADCRRYCKEKPGYAFGRIWWGKLK